MGMMLVALALAHLSFTRAKIISGIKIQLLDWQQALRSVQWPQSYQAPAC